MKLYITECTDSTALLRTDIGKVIATFSSVDEAVEECANWLEDNNYYADFTECYLAD